VHLRVHFLYLIRNIFIVPQLEQAFLFVGFQRFDYSLSLSTRLVNRKPLE
jgi:hypothetical protein